MSEVRGRAVSSYLRAIKAVSSSEKDLSKLSVKTPSSSTSKRKSHQQQQQQQTTSSSSNTSRRRLLVSNNIRDIQGMFQAFNRHKHKSSNGNIHDSSSNNKMDRFCDSSSLTSVETMPSPPLRNRKLSRRRSSQPCLNSNSSEDEEMDHDPKHDNNSDDFKCDSGFVEDQHSHPKSELQRRQKFIITAGEDLSSLESTSSAPSKIEEPKTEVKTLPVAITKPKPPLPPKDEATKLVIDINNKTRSANSTNPTTTPVSTTMVKSESHPSSATISVAKKKSKREISLVLEPTPKKCSGYVGFANLPNQVYRKAVKKGFEFSLMVVGESGLGKSTLINSMFLTDIYEQNSSNSTTKLPQTLDIQEQKVKLVENDVHLTLTVVDTPGFGDAVDNSQCWDPIIHYVENQFDNYLESEMRVARFPIADQRVHVCLYFIAPTGHALKPLDIEFMKRIHDKVNIVPVIGKADTLTPEELSVFKKQIMKQIGDSQIHLYQFPQESEINAKLPFAVVGSNCVLDINGEKIRGRRYPWGVVNIESLEHCDFLSLRDMLIRTHLQDLKEKTSDSLYENYRCQKLSKMVCKNANQSPIQELEEEKKEHAARLLKMEKEMEEVFERKVREKQRKLTDTESDLKQKLSEAQEKLDKQKEELDDKIAHFEKERLAWSRMYGVSMEELSNFDDNGKKKSKTVTLNGVTFRIGR